MIPALIEIGFLNIRWIDLIDIILVATLLFYVYKLLRGSIAVNIFLGLLLIYLAWFVVRLLKMELLSGIIGQFMEVGVLALLIVFQPEIRRFLLFLGRKRKLKNIRLFSKWLGQPNWNSEQAEVIAKKMLQALWQLEKQHSGALIVLTQSSRLQLFANSGQPLDAVISARLLEAIFQKNSPLHDGAVIIAEGKIVAAGCVLPVSENPGLPVSFGLRHRSAVGITEQSDALAIILSEEKGSLAYAENGQLQVNITQEQLETKITQFLSGFDTAKSN